MSTRKDDGGPAFPESVAADSMGGLNFSRERGLSLRDYFAAQALTGVLSNLSEMSSDVRSAPDSCERFARDCYRMADAMLAARAEQER